LKKYREIQKMLTVARIEKLEMFTTLGHKHI